MLLGFNFPSDWVYSGTAVWQDASAPYLHDRRTQPRARLTWPSGAQTTATNVTIVTTRAGGGFVARCGMMVGLSLPVGTLVTIAGVRADFGTALNLGGNSTTQRTVMFADGTVGIMWVFDDKLPAINGYTITIYNDVNGVASIPAGSTQSIGEANVCPALYMCHSAGWKSSRKDPSIVSRTLGSQAYRVQRRNYRTASMRPVFDSSIASRGGFMGDSIEGGVNVCRMPATATASSTNAAFTPMGAINGYRRGNVWAAGDGWNDNTPNTFPDWWQVVFAKPANISTIDVYTLADDYASRTTDPTDTTLFTLAGLTAYDVQVTLDGTTWTTVCGVAGNYNVKRSFATPTMNCRGVKIICNASADNTSSRLVQVEAWARMDWEQVNSIIANDPFTLVFDDISTPALIQRSGLFGICTNVPSIDSVSGPYYQYGQFDFEEVPA